MQQKRTLKGEVWVPLGWYLQPKQRTRFDLWIDPSKHNWIITSARTSKQRASALRKGGLLSGDDCSFLPLVMSNVRCKAPNGRRLEESTGFGDRLNPTPSPLNGVPFFPRSPPIPLSVSPPPEGEGANGLPHTRHRGSAGAHDAAVRQQGIFPPEDRGDPKGRGHSTHPSKEPNSWSVGGEKNGRNGKGLERAKLAKTGRVTVPLLPPPLSCCSQEVDPETGAWARWRGRSSSPPA